MITIYVMEHMGVIPIENMALWAVCFVNAVFSRF